MLGHPLKYYEMKPELLEVSLAYTVDWSQLLVASELLFTQTKLSLR